MFVNVQPKNTLWPTVENQLFSILFREGSDNEENKLAVQDEGKGEDVEAEKHDRRLGVSVIRNGTGDGGSADGAGRADVRKG